MESLSLLRRKRDSWPDPHLSVGRHIKRFGNKNCWEAIGPVREAFLRIGAEIKTHLDKNIEPLPCWVTWSIYMVGNRADTSVPTVIFCSESEKVRRDIKKIVDESEILAQHPGIKTRHMRRAPEFNELVQLGGGTDYSDMSLPATPSNAVVYHMPGGEVMGKRIFVQNGGKTKTATVGGVLECGLDLFYFTAAHTFCDDAAANTDLRPLSDSDDELRGSSDSESEGASDEWHEGTSLGSITPDYAKSDQDLDSSDDLSLKALDLSHSLSSSSEEPNATNPKSSNSVAGPQSISPCVSESRPGDREHQGRRHPCSRSLSPAQEDIVDAVPPGAVLLTGSVFLSSSQHSRSLDYALIKIGLSEQLSPWCLNQLDTGDAHLAADHFLEVPREDVPVGMVTGTNGYVAGRLCAVPSFLAGPGSKDFQKVFKVEFEGKVSKGDCGAWVVDRETGGLYGHIIAGSPDSRMVYIVPVSEVLSDIERRTAWIPTLPSSGISPPLQGATLAADNDRRDGLPKESLRHHVEGSMITGDKPNKLFGAGKPLSPPAAASKTVPQSPTSLYPQLSSSSKFGGIRRHDSPSDPSSSKAKVGFANSIVTGISRPVTNDEHWTLYYFENHAALCKSCFDPLTVSKSGRQLCAQGHKLAVDVAHLLFRRKDGEVYSREKENHKEVRVELPHDYVQSKSLLIAIQRSLKKGERFIKPGSIDKTYYVPERRSKTPERFSEPPPGYAVRAGESSREPPEAPQLPVPAELETGVKRYDDDDFSSLKRGSLYGSDMVDLKRGQTLENRAGVRSNVEIREPSYGKGQRRFQLYS